MFILFSQYCFSFRIIFFFLENNNSFEIAFIMNLNDIRAKYTHTHNRTWNIKTTFAIKICITFIIIVCCSHPLFYFTVDESFISIHLLIINTTEVFLNEKHPWISQLCACLTISMSINASFFHKMKNKSFLQWWYSLPLPWFFECAT